MGKPEDDKKLAAWSEGAEQIHNRAELIIAKHRHGPTDTVEMFFDPELTRFSSLGGATTASPWAVDLGCDVFDALMRSHRMFRSLPAPPTACNAQIVVRRFPLRRRAS